MSERNIYARLYHAETERLAFLDRERSKALEEAWDAGYIEREMSWELGLESVNPFRVRADEETKP